MFNKDDQTNHWKNKSRDCVLSYFSGDAAVKRSLWFCGQLEKYKFGSILECGFFSGRNLYYIQKQFPEVNVSGIEINREAIKFAQTKLPKANLKEINIYDLDKIDTMFDIVFTSGVLIHIIPNDLQCVVEKIISKANKYVMHIEQLGNSELIAGPKELKPKYKISDQTQFNINIVPIYESLGYKPEVIGLPKEVRTNGAKELIIVDVRK